MSFRKLGGIAGLVFVVLIVGNTLLLGDQPTPDESTREILRYLSEDTGRHDAALVVGFFVLPAAVLFFAGLFHRLRPSDRAHDESWAIAMLLGAVLLGAVVSVGDVVVGTAMLHEGNLDPGVARALWDFQYIAYTAAGAAMATFVLSVAVPVLRHRILAPWYGWLSVLVAALGVASVFGVVSPNSWISYLGFPAIVVWVLITSILMLSSREEPAPHTTAGLPPS
jgi:hypothetical protein